MTSPIFLSMRNSDQTAWWALSSEDCLRKLGSEAARGLGESEASKRLQDYGPNCLPEKPPTPPLVFLIRQFQSLIVGVLVAAALISLALGESLDAWIILAIVVLNAGLGFVQEMGAEKSLRALKKMATPHSRVTREGQPRVMAAADLVPGDIVTLEAGDHVPADGRILRSYGFKVLEASLTGESSPVSKQGGALLEEKTPLADRKNMVYLGTSAAGGKAVCVVTGTGSSTELGRIASLLEESSDGPTPLQRRLAWLGSQLVYIFLAVVALVFGLGVLRGNPPLEMLMTALSLAVAAIPEGLPAVVTISLAIGVTRMARRSCIVRTLPSVETLGCASVICSDKTGTLTQNQMTVRKLWVPEGTFEVSGTGYAPEGNFRFEGKEISVLSEGLLRALKISALCNGAALQKKDSAWEMTGDPTEGALLAAAGKAELFLDRLEREEPLLCEIPFDSDRKCMSMIRRLDRGAMLYHKGAPDGVLSKCTKILRDNYEEILDEAGRERIRQVVRGFSSEALRVLGVAYGRLEEQPDEAGEAYEKDLVFSGLLAMMDPPREEARQAIKTCALAGITPVMITGDHAETAAAIARELGMLQPGDPVHSGTELDAMSEAALEREVQRTRVYARVTAEHKLRIVRALRKNGAVVAMTGDGVNDAPAVKEADIGIAMGITGTDVTKEASDMVITDDNFASIVTAVELGRGIYDNIVKFVHYLLSSNIAEVLILFLAVAMDLRDASGASFVPLTPVQILWMNLVTDGLPAIALALDPVARLAMKKPPRRASEPLITRRGMVSILLTSAALTAAVFVACFHGLARGPEAARTMTLTALVCFQMVRVQRVRADYGMSFFSNGWLIGALLLSLGLQLLLVHEPRLRQSFGLVSLQFDDWVVLGLCTAGLWGLGAAMNALLNHFPPEGKVKSIS